MLKVIEKYCCMNVQFKTTLFAYYKGKYTIRKWAEFFYYKRGRKITTNVCEGVRFL